MRFCSITILVLTSTNLVKKCKRKYTLILFQELYHHFWIKYFIFENHDLGIFLLTNLNTQHEIGILNGIYQPLPSGPKDELHFIHQRGQLTNFGVSKQIQDLHGMSIPTISQIFQYFLQLEKLLLQKWCVKYILRNEGKKSLTNFDGIIIHIAQKGCCFTLSVHAHMHLTSHCGRICQILGKMYISN